MKKVIYVLLAVILITEISYPQWIKTSGPFGGTATCFLYNNNKLYAVSGYDAFFSTNLGVSWTYIPNLSGKKVKCLTLIGNNIFAGTYSGVFISSNDGLSWNPVNSGLTNLHINALTVSGTTLIAALDGFGAVGGIYRTTNNGQNWISSIGTGNFISLNSTGSNVYAGSYGNGFYISTNGGVNFIQAINGLSNGYVNAITNSGNSIFAGTTSGIYKTTNYGQNWFESNTGITDNDILCFGTSGTNIFAGTTSKIFLSTDNGFNWSAVMNGIPSSVFTAVYAYGANTYTGNNVGIYLTTNNGTLWTEKNEGYSSKDVWDVLSLNGSLFASTSTGLYRSTDNGDSWFKAGLNNYSISMIFSLNNYLFALANSVGLCRTTNNGLNWTVLSYPPGIESYTFNGNTIFVGTLTKGVCRTTNYGDTWDTVNTGITSRDITAMGSHNGTVYCGTWNDWWVYKSTNNGNTWTNMGLEGHILSFAFDNENVMVGRCDSIFRTTNGGINWQPVCVGIQMGCENTKLYQSGNNIFVTFCGKLYMTTNFGTNWIFKGQGLENYDIVSFAFGTDKVFASVYKASVWKRGLTEIIGIEKISSEVPEKIMLMQNYPNPFNPSTNIRYQIANNRLVTLRIFDILGKEISTLVNEKQQPGTYEVTWDGGNYPSGVYYYKLTAGDYSESKKMVLIK